MGSLKALQEWCRIQCEDYNDVEIKNMSSSFRDGLAFCAIIHRFRPDLIDFPSLSKENVYENNRLAFEVAEAQLGIPALLDPEDMVSMRVPDRLSIITYVSQYYNFFTNKSHANPPCMKRPAGSGPGEPAQKRLMAPAGDKVAESETAQSAQPAPEDADLRLRCGTLSSTCTACLKHVHLVQRFLVDGKLYHRNCFRCRECSSTLLPGSYKPGKESGSLICTHHFTRPALANQNGRPDLSRRPDLSPRPAEAQSAGLAPSPAPQQAPPPESEREATPPPVAVAAAAIATDQNATTGSGSLAGDTPAAANLSDSLIIEEEPSAPPNPFDESDEEGGDEEEAPNQGEKQQQQQQKQEEEQQQEKQEKEEIQTPAKETSCEARRPDKPPAPVAHPVGVTRPVPAPRRVPEATPPPRPAPRVRPHPTPERQEVNGERQKPLLPPKPRERSHSPGSQSIDTPKSKDPPWLALVQSEPKKKPAPPPPPAGLATPPHAGSLSSLKAEGSAPASAAPGPPANPFDDDDDGDNDQEGGDEEAPAVVAVNHPWYRITQPAEAGAGTAAAAAAADTPPAGGSSSRSSSPGGGKGKKRPAPRAPRTPSANPALSIESLSSGSDPGSSQAPRQEHPFTKSVSEPSISTPGDPSAPPSSSCSQEPQLSLSPAPPAVPANTSSAPATPQTNRSGTARAPRHPPPPRPPTTTPSPLAAETPAANSKRTCKENPFNRKASPSHASAQARPPRGPRPARPPAPGHGFPLIKRKVQSDQYIPVEDIHGEMSQLERQLDQLEQRGVELESKLRDNPNDEEEEHLLVEWFTLIHDKHLLVRREAELVYTSKQQNLEERQGDVEYELRCLLNKPEKDWSEEDRSREQELMADLVTIIEQRNQIINNMDQDRQRDEEEDKLMAAMLKKKDFHKEPDGDEEKEKEKKKKKGPKFKPMKVLKRLSHKGDPGKTPSPRKDKS